MTNTTEKLALAKHIEDFANGISLVLSSMSFVTEKGQILEGIINGDNYAQDRYQHCFSYSFDDEDSEISMFAEAFAEYVDAPFVPLNSATIIALDEYQGCVLGFHIAKKALEEVVTICRENEALKKELVALNPHELEAEEEYGTYNPFKLYGVIEFEKKFKGFRRAYLAELRQIISEKKFLQIENEINPYLEEADTRKFKIKA